MKLAHVFITMTACLGLVLPYASRAAVVWFSEQDVVIPDTFAGVSIDLESGATSTSLAGVSGGDVNFYFGGERISNDGDSGATVASFQTVHVPGTSNTDPIQNVSTSATIGTGVGALTPDAYTTPAGFGASTTHIGTQFSASTPGYLGFSLVIDNPSNPGNDLTVYDWARVTLNDDGTGTVHEWAYDDTGAYILVGAVPVASAALLMLVAGMTLLRRRRA